jgi:SAM-dependent methyltransferase
VSAAVRAFDAYTAARVAHWDETARRLDRWQGWGALYQKRLTRAFRHVCPPGLRVLELGCGRGDLLAALQPREGVGVDFSPEMIRRARARHPELTFVDADAHGFAPEGTVDVVVLSDLVNDLWDVEKVLERLRPALARHSRLVLNFYSRLWEPPLALAERLRLAKPNLQQNWFTPEDVHNLLGLAGYDVVTRTHEILWPVETPLVEPLVNRWLARLWPFNLFCVTNVVLARRAPGGRADETAPPRVSVVVPARNEAGNVEGIFARTPEMGAGTELVFVEGHSKDDTYAAIERAIAAHPERRALLLKQGGKGKGDAVRAGFAAATGDVLMILDADLTVPPEDLPRFYDALVTGKGEFVNGVRLVYPMEGDAMRFANLVGNKFFALAFRWLLGQPVKDTLCGTKVLTRRDYELIAANRAYFGDFDPFGDFDLLFGAARLGRKIVDLPIRYQARTYGETNIQRWRHGVLLLRMVLFAARRLKFT